MYHKVVTKLRPKCVRFVRIYEQAAIPPPLGFIIEDSIYCAVRTESLHTTQNISLYFVLTTSQQIRHSAALRTQKFILRGSTSFLFPRQQSTSHHRTFFTAPRQLASSRRTREYSPATFRAVNYHSPPVTTKMSLPTAPFILLLYIPLPPSL